MRKRQPDRRKRQLCGGVEGPTLRLAQMVGVEAIANPIADMKINTRRAACC